MVTLLKSRDVNQDLAFVEEQLRAHADPYDTVRLMWEQRRAALLEELASLASSETKRAEVAVMFEGQPVRGSQDIRLDFATKALDSYQQIVASLVAARAGAQLGARGRLPQSFTSKLFIRDMMRGSVGFLLEEPETQQSELLASALKDSVNEASSILRDLSSSDQTFLERLPSLSPRTLIAIKRLSKVLNDAGAETKIISGDDELKIDSPATTALYARLTEFEVVEDRETKTGVLYGLLPERQQYEFKPDGDSPVFYGPVSEELDNRYLRDPGFAGSILLKPVTATFLIITTVRAGQIQSQERVLEDVALRDLSST